MPLLLGRRCLISASSSTRTSSKLNKVINIKTMTPLVLKQTSTFYSHWHSLFLNKVTKYALDDLVLVDLHQ